VTEQERLRVEVAGLRIVVEALVEALDSKVQTKVETEVAAKGVPREEYRRRVRASGKRVVGGFGVVLLLAVVLGFLIWQTQTLVRENRHLIAQVASTCTDPKASAATRRHVTNVIEIIKGSQQTKPGQPGYIPQKQASQRFVEAYEKWGRDMGDPPDCRGLVP
jgi:hypothetical protein